VRLFVGIAPDLAAREQLAAWVAQLRSAAGEFERAFRWTAPGNIHVTLSFLGDVGDELAARIRSSIGEPLDLPPFDAHVGPLGSFPSHGAPRVLWAAIAEGAAAMVQVQRRIAERLASLGVPGEDRTFTPHLTLARVRDRERRVARALRWPPPIEVPAIRFRVDGATLFRSDLSGATPRYEALAAASLVGPQGR
jgi:2'-5' RNA ligase